MEKRLSAEGEIGFKSHPGYPENPLAVSPLSDSYVIKVPSKRDNEAENRSKTLETLTHKNEPLFVAVLPRIIRHDRFVSNWFIRQT